MTTPKNQHKHNPFGESQHKHNPIIGTVVAPYAATAIFLIVASNMLSWTSISTIIVGAALVIAISVLGIPLTNLINNLNSAEPKNTTQKHDFFLSMLVFSIAVGIGIFLAVASHSLDWSGTTLCVVGCALVAVGSLLGTPLFFLTSENSKRPLHPTTADTDQD